MADLDSQPIIIVRKNKHHAAHHGGAWKVAYADFVTAMMALFIVLWLLSSSQKVQKAVGGYFTDPSGKGKQVGSTMAGAGEAVSVSEDNMDMLKEMISEALKKAPQLDSIRDQIEMTVTGEGLRIELIETERGMFFESGNAQPSGPGIALLELLARQLGALPNTIVVEGHTDSRPYLGRGNYGNWELSADRANSARRLMQEQGLREDQVRQVRGFADQRLRNEEAPEAANNRRVSVIVQYLRQPDTLESQDEPEPSPVQLKVTP